MLFRSNYLSIDMYRSKVQQANEKSRSEAGMRRNGFCGGVIIWMMVAARSFAQDSAAPGPLYINEFMASNVLAHENSSGDYEDWIEICNSGPSRDMPAISTWLHSSTTL